jgi:hypothetical protein
VAVVELSLKPVEVKAAAVLPDTAIPALLAEVRVTVERLTQTVLPASAVNEPPPFTAKPVFAAVPVPVKVVAITAPESFTRPVASELAVTLVCADTLLMASAIWAPRKTALVVSAIAPTSTPLIKTEPVVSAVKDDGTVAEVELKNDTVPVPRPVLLVAPTVPPTTMLRPSAAVSATAPLVVL